MSLRWLQDVEHVSNPRTANQNNFAKLDQRAYSATPNAGAGAGPPATGDWQLHDYYWDADGVRWRCIAAGSPGTWVQDGGLTLDQLIPTGAAIPTTQPGRIYIRATEGVRQLYVKVGGAWELWLDAFLP